ncbi:hypothetical protein ABT173_01935 [Streptomyces sp. NPDC001795]|uniref:hypothetical protein n=1 Tax=Streptomyces sp. NPDC001795 TaxID=3154525 RepID=UPI00331F98F2
MGRPAAIEETESGAGSPASSPLATLLPGGRVRAGTVVSAGGDMPLLLALAAEASRSTPGWAAVGLPQLGVLAAQAAGLDLAHGMRIDSPGRQWAQVLATVLEAVPVVMTGSLDSVPDRVARRLGAVMRRSGSVLLSADGWPGADVRLQVVASSWEGIGQGHGLLHGRRVTVAAAGRGAAAAARHAEMWLPGPNGTIAPLLTEGGHAPAVSEPAAMRAVGGRAGLRVVG